MSREVYIAAVARTPVGNLGGNLAPLTATQLGSIAIEGALKRAGITPDLVDFVYMGNVLSAGVGQNPARQAATGAGLPTKVVTASVNKVCASGLKAIIMGTQDILSGTADIVISGGMESMSNVPYYIPKARQGLRYGHSEMLDGIVVDGLYDVYNQYLMGHAAELIASDLKMTREQQDDYALESYRKAQRAQKENLYAEIVPVTVPGPRGKPPTIITADEESSKPIDEPKFRSVKPAFKENGTVTAPNSSPINDGGAAVVLISGSKAKELNIPVIAKIRGWGEAEQKPEYFTTSPSLAIPKALNFAGLKIEDVDYFEINEAFSAVAIANQQLLKLDPAKLNAFGGAVAIGHPLGCSGARIVSTLVSVLQHHKGRIGVAGVCNGGGGASSLIIELV